LALLACALIWTAESAHAQRTPFGAPAVESSRQAPSSSLDGARSQSAFGRFWQWIQSTQQSLHKQLAGAVRRLKTEQSLFAAWLLVSLGFVYGVVHAVGPGHGKAVISSYVLANERTVKRGILLSFLASMVQAISAIAIVAILAIALNAVGLRIKDAAATLETASYALIALIGAWLLVAQFWPRATGHHHGHDHSDGSACGHSHMPDPRELEDGMDLRKMAAIVLAVGIRPCTGALVVLVFAIAQGILWAGIAATFAMALGTAITVSALAVLAVASKQLAYKFAGGDSRWTGWIYRATAIGGSAMVMLIGVVLFIGSLGPARPF
jgi:ABC-type nickel/cobalt efflux system permease component RcnA